MTYKVIRTKTVDECITEALLLGYAYVEGPHWFRVRIGPNNFAGMADFKYICAESMNIVHTQSEIDDVR